LSSSSSPSSFSSSTTTSTAITAAAVAAAAVSQLHHNVQPPSDPFIASVLHSRQNPRPGRLLLENVNNRPQTMDRGTQANTEGSAEVITEAPTTSNGPTNNELVSMIIIYKFFLFIIKYHYYKNITKTAKNFNFLTVIILKKNDFKILIHQIKKKRALYIRFTDIKNR